MIANIGIFGKRVITYLLRRCFGQYLETFTHEELSFDYCKGKAVIENVALRVEALNLLIDDYNLPFELLNGHIGEVVVEVPWTAPFTENSIVAFRGVNLVMHPKKCAEDVSMFASMFDSMTSSLQMAEECLSYKLKDEPEIESPTESVETIVQAIDAVFSKLKVKFIDTVIRIESVLDDGITGIALEIKIQNASCFDEAGVESVVGKNLNSEKNSYQPSAYSVKKCLFDGISLYTMQFPASTNDINSEYNSTTIPSPGSPEMPPQHASLLMPKEEKVVQMEPVLISRVLGQQQLRLKLKQNDSIVGPKVDIEINLGALNLFLSPYQLFLLIELTNGLTKPGSGNRNDMNSGLRTASNRPMREVDYALVQQELDRQHDQLSMPSKALHPQQGWSSHSMEETDEGFHLMKVENKAPEIPIVTDDFESSYSSSISSEKMFTVYSSNDGSCSRKSSKSKGSNLHALLTDPLIESTQIHLSCSTFTIVLLHDHRWTEDTSKLNSNNTFDTKDLMNFTALKILSEEYFDQLSSLSMEGLNFKDFASVRDKVSKLTKANHLRFVSSGLTLDVNEKTSSMQRAFTTLLSLLDVEILECLFNTSNDSSSATPIHTPILSFAHENLRSSEQATEFREPCLRIKYDQYDHGTQFRSLTHPPNKLVFHMAPVALEVDISIANRIQSLLNPDVTFPSKGKKTESFSWRDDSDMNSYSPQKTEVEFICSFVLVNLRFPVPDLRPFIDRTPWWKQNLRDEILVMELADASLSFVLDAEKSEKVVEIQCRDFHGLLKVSANEAPVSFIRVSANPNDPKMLLREGFEWPRLVISTTPQISALSRDSERHIEQEDNYFTSFNQESTVQLLLQNMKKEPSPFSNTSVAFGSKLASSPSALDEDGTLHDEIVTPADKKKLYNFIENIVGRSQYVFDFNLPTVNIVLPDRNFFELLYNRLGSDLILFEFAPVIPVNTHDACGPTPSILDLNLHPVKETSYESFNSCDNDSNTDSDEDMYTFHSIRDHSLKRIRMKKDSSNDHVLTKLSIHMNIVKGSLTMHCPLTDENKCVSIDSCGKLQLCVDDCKFFIASCYKGNPVESYICLLSNRAYLYHDNIVPLVTEKSIVQPFAEREKNSTNLIIYPSEKGVPLKSGIVVGKGSDSMDVLSISVRVLSNPKQKIKTFKMAIGINGSTLRHYMNPSSQLWLNQFTNFIQVQDYPILGYVPCAVIIELHLHLMNCGIDYRPLYLPLKSFLTFESFSLSTNITATTNSSLLRIISEELCLFLSNDMKIKQVDLKKDYVCVLDTGLIDLSVRFTTIDEQLPPKFEICASNNMINIYTCSDSCQALQKFIIYLANYGDFVDASTPTDDLNETEESMTSTENSLCSIPNVHNLMAEAMIDCSLPKHSNMRNENSDSDLNDSDESFCIIEDDVGVGVVPKNREPQIKVLTTDPIKIDDEYFKVPSGKSDLLKAPKHFPEPLLCQTLREMSITWHLYGGNDFKSTKSSEKKHVRYNSSPEKKDSNLNSLNFEDSHSIKINKEKSTISFCKVTPMTKEFNINAIHYSMEQISINPHVVTQENAARSWILKGGKDRDRNILMEFQLTKVRYQHEEYPETSEFVSRDVLVIHDIEIRDKLEDSDFNKFLYQYSSESMPRQTHANMFVVKSVKIRPDPKQKSEECSLKVSCKPMRLNVDQDALMFLFDFFKVVFEEPESNSQSNNPSNEENIASEVQQNPSTPKSMSLPTTPTSPMPSQISSSPVFFRSFSFSPDVLIRFDYKGKRVVMEQGTLQGILMGFGQLNCSEITLKRLSYRHGLLGWEKLLTYAFNEWCQDIKRNQLPRVLGGVGPMHSILQLFQGLKDFVWLPVMQYRKDGQIVRGLQRGASSFSTSTAAAVLELTSQFVSLIQGAAVYAYDMVSPGPSVAYKLQGNMNDLRRASQPADIREGMTCAYKVVKDGFSDEYHAIAQIASTEHEQKGIHGAVGGVFRQIPSVVVTPIIFGAKAAGIMLDGARHQLVPDAHKEAVDKWRTKNNAS